MKGIGWIVILFGMFAAVYLVVQDLDALSGERGGQAVMEPMERAKETASLVGRTQDSLQRGLDNIDQ